MTTRKNSKISYVNLHAHTTAGSPFDALGYPAEHLDFAYNNGLNAHAITDHGNCNALAGQVLHAKKMESEGKDFKIIYGCEAYFLPSVEDWKEEYEKIKADKKSARTLSKEQSGTTIEDEEASKREIKNILNRRRHLVLLVQNQIGLNNLFQLVSRAYSGSNFYRYPRIDFKDLEEFGEGIIVLTACMGGPLAGDYWENREEGEEAVQAAMRNTITRFKSIFGDRFYGEVQWNSIPEQHSINKHVLQICKEMDVEVVSTADCHYPSPEAWKDRELYKRIGWMGKGRPTWADDDSTELPAGVDEVGYELYPKNGDEMWEAYKKYAALVGIDYNDTEILETIERAHDIAENRIEKFYPDTTVRLPDFVIPVGETADSALRNFALAGLREFGLHDKPEYIDRMEHELTVIADRGFSKYFLTMKAIADESNEKMITGPGRGSAAGSLLAYALKITQVDPIKHGLLFSRFLRSDATDYPDIDFDVADPMTIKDRMIEKWGKNSVVPISNWNTLQLRSLIKDISKFYNIPFAEVNAVTSVMEREALPAAKAKNGIKAGIYVPTFDELMEFSPTLKGFLAEYPQVADHISRLYGQVRSCSRHAGGVLIADDLNKHMPLINSGGVTQTPWSEGQNVRHLEPMGFIKFDILGLSTLRMIEGAIYHILKRHDGIENPTFEDIRTYYNKYLHPDVIDLNDQKVYQNIFHGGKWAGVFQFTETGAQTFCQKAQPISIIDVSAVTSIYRPGPLAADVDEQYIQAKEAPQYVQYVNDIHQEVTEETYGFLIFQEQIALLAHLLGKDLTIDEGNMLRKVLTKKGTGKEAAVKKKLRNKFVQGCIDKGLKRTTGDKLWQNFEYFSGYGFNKSHAVSYSILSFQCAWLLNYYPSEWCAAFLDKEPETRKEKAINIVKSLGFEIREIDINKSGRVWEIDAEDSSILIQPMTSLKGFGEAAVQQILDNRPLNTIDDLLFNENITYSKLNKKALDVLCRAGALDNIWKSDGRFTGAKHFWSACIVDRPRKPKHLVENIELYSPEGDFTETERIQYQIELTGIFPFNRVMRDEIYARLKENVFPAISDFDPEVDEVCWFIPRKIYQKKTKNGVDYWILDVLDDNNIMTKIRCWGVRPDDKINVNRPYLARLEFNNKWGFSSRSIKRNFRLLC